MNFSALSIRNPVPAILLFLLLSLAGILAYRATMVQDFPDIELPVVTVSASLPGAAASQMETEVARKIEDSVATLQGVKNIYTRVLEGEATVTVEFVLERQLSEALNDVRDAVARVRADLPADLRDPSVTKTITAGRVVLTFAAAAKTGPDGKPTLDDQELSWFVDNTLAKRLLAVPGVGSVRRVGGVSREERITLDPLKMAGLGVSALDVSQRLRQVQQDVPSGRGDVGGAEQSVRTIAAVHSAAQLAALDLPLADGRHLRLGDVASVEDTVSEARALAQLNGRRVVGFEVYRTRGASEIAVAQAARAAVEELQRAHPELVLEKVIDNAEPVQENFRGSMELLYEGAILAVLVVWCFLRSWRATIVAAAALPLSVIPTFLGMYWFGYSLNTVTLLALALVVGVLVDDAIVEIENIERHLEMGKTPMQAALEAADEIGMAVIATTFALVSVFLPTAFMAGVPGLFFKQFGWTAVLAILASLVVARLLTPMMAAYFLKPSRRAHRPDGLVMRSYLALAGWCVRHRMFTAFASALFFAASLALVPLLPTGFAPPSDRGQTQITLELAPGSTLAETAAAAEVARRLAIQDANITGVFASIGGGTVTDLFNPGAAGEARKATLTLTTTHRNQRRATMTQIEQGLRRRLEAIPGVRYTVGPPDLGVKMQLVLKSDDPLALAAAARRVEGEIRTLRGIGAVSSSASLVRPEILVRPDVARAAELGVTATAIGETVRVATAGDYETNLPKLNLAERQVPIRIRLPDAVRADLDALSRLYVPGRKGPVMLGSVASIAMDSGAAQIDRLNRSRNVTFTIELGSRSLGDLNTEVRALPAVRGLPPSVRVAELGDAQQMRELFSSFGLAMSIGVLCIYGVLVLLFRDFLQPATILAALPLSIGGALVALLLTGRALSMPSLIGLIMLMGIVTKNSILLVDYAILARRAGMDRFDALIDACHKRSRPIIMTTIAMGAGMLPLAMGWGADPSFRSPMAIAVIGGLITSTLLSLLVVPAVFTYVDDAGAWLGRRFRQRHEKPAPAQAMEAHK